MDKLVSLIMIVRNGERYLEAAIQSVLNTKYPLLEIIIIDGHSTDRTAEIARSFSDVKYFLQDGKGASAAYNQGIQYASGDLIAFNSYDDYWLPNKLSLQISALHEHPNAQFAVCKVKFVLADESYIPAGFRKSLLDITPDAYIMETLLARKSVFNEVGLFNTDYETGEDVDWFSRARDLGIESIVVPEVLVHKRIHESNSSISSENTKFLLKIMKASVQRKRANHHE